MRVLLDEHIPVDLAGLLPGHEVRTVVGQGWTGIKNGELLRRATGHFEAFVTMDRNLEFQQNLKVLPFGVVLVLAPSNRMRDLQPLAPAIAAGLSTVRPGDILRVGT